MNMPNMDTKGKDKVTEDRLKALRDMQHRGGGRNAVMAQRMTIPKKKFIEGEAYIQIMPAILAVPFNPTDMADESYNNEVRFLFKGMSAYAGALELKALLSRDDETATAAAAAFGVEVKMLELDTEGVSPELLSILKRYRTVDITSYPVQKMKFSDPAFKFGRSYLANIDLDPNNDPVLGDDIPLSIRLWQMETSLVATQVKMRAQLYDEGGELSDRPKKELEEETKAAWKNRLISNPYPFGVVRSVIIPTDREFTPVKESVTSLLNASNYFTFECYTGINGKFLKEELEDKAGSKKDRYFDFFAVRVDCKTKQKPEETLLEVVGRTTRSLCGADEEFTESLPNFVEKYRAYRDEPSFWKPEILLKSVMNFRTIDDASLLQRMKDDISKYEIALKSKDIVTQFGSLLTRIDAQLGTELLMLSGGDELPAMGLTDEDLAKAPKESTEDTTMAVQTGVLEEGLDMDMLAKLMTEGNDAPGGETPEGEQGTAPSVAQTAE